jgi:hypothetical protein
LSSLCFIASLALFGVSQALAATITYDLTTLTIGTLSLTGGYITTDGTIGPLASTDITAWSVTITGGFPSPDTVTGTSPLDSFVASGSPLTASATALTFDFSSLSSDQFILGMSGLTRVSYLALPPEIGLSTGGPLTVESFTTAFVIASVTATPLPAALPLFAGGLGMMGLLGWRRKRKSAAAGDA